MNKKFSYSKNLLSLSVLMILINFIMIYVVFKKTGNNLPIWTDIIYGILVILAFCFIFLFWFFRIKSIIKTPDFKLTKKEWKNGIIAISIYVLNLVLGVIFIIFSHKLQSITAMFWICLVTSLLLAILGSIFELSFRIGFQLFLLWKQGNNDAQRGGDYGNSQTIDIQNPEVTTPKRSAEAQEIIDKDFKNNKNPFDD